MAVAGWFEGQRRGCAMWDSKMVVALWICLVSFGRFNPPCRNALLMHEGRHGDIMHDVHRRSWDTGRGEEGHPGARGQSPGDLHRVTPTVRASGQKHTSIGLISAGKVFSWLWCRPGLEAVACRSSRSLPGSILASYNIWMHTEVLKTSVAPGTKRGQAA